MAKIEIDTSKWGRNLKYVIGIICFIFLMFAGYKLFVTKEWSLNPESEHKLILAEEQVRVLTDSLEIIAKYNDSIGKINDRKYKNYQSWKRDSDNFKELKEKFDEARRHNATLSADDHVRLLSEWLNE